ncbi:MAG: alpha/beta hydrolase, partial [Pseudomonadota bacterium]
GAIGLAAIYRGVISPGAVALSAPMLGVQMSGSMKVAAAVTTGIARVLGRLDRRPPLGDADKPYVFEGFEGNVLTGDREMFAWLESVVRAEPRLQIAMPSLRWFDEAETEMGWLSRQGSLSMPVLLLKGSEEAVVDREAIAEAATRLGGELVEITGARHEFFIERAELRDAAWQAVDTFLATHGL